MENVFDYKDYKEYLIAVTGGKRSRKGVKLAFSKVLRCQTSFISQVIHGNLHLSQEQAIDIGIFLSLTRDELQYFQLIVQKSRAGTENLKKFIDNQISELMEKRLNVISRLGKKATLTKNQQAIYYSSWTFAAVHVACMIPGMGEPLKLIKELNISKQQLIKVIDFLEKSNLIVKTSLGYKATESIVRINKYSSSIIPHHSNWRKKAMESLDFEDLNDLHFSGVYCLDTQAALKIKDKLLEELKNVVKNIEKAPSKKMMVLTLDWFEITRKIN